MGQAKKRMLEMESIDDLEVFLNEILDSNVMLHKTVEGIAKQVRAKGIDSMTEKQRNVIDVFVEKFKEDNHCNRCIDGNIGSLTDYIYIHDNRDSLCSSCQYDYEKLMAE